MKRTFVLLLMLAAPAFAVEIELPSMLAVHGAQDSVTFEWRGARIRFVDDPYADTPHCKHGFSVPYGGIVSVHLHGGTYNRASMDGWGGSISGATFYRNTFSTGPAITFDPATTSPE